jgi:transcription-repair coupling factor (superfamily II helicase)
MDLEIRGAGNLLGGEQSGQIEAVGFEMYTKLLEETIRELKGEDVEDDSRATVNLGVDLKIDESYIPDMNQRLMVYRKIAAARTSNQLESALDELRDRYGAPPPSVLNLAEYGRIRVMADRLGVDAIDREGRLVVIRFRPTAKVDPLRLVKVIAEWPGATFVPPVSLKLDLEAAPTDKGARGNGQSGQAAGPPVKGRISGRPVHVPIPGRPAHGLAHGGLAQRRGGPSGPPEKAAGPPDSSRAGWWTARASAGEVKAGFTKEEILRRPQADPRAEGGMFAQLEGLLDALS